MKILAKIPMTPMMVVVIFASNEIPWALKIGTMYERIANIAVNCITRNKRVTKANGLSVRFFVISMNLSSNVGGGWGHFILNFEQLSQDADIWLICFSCSNSIEILSVETQPLSTCKFRCASSVRFFESNQIGVSGIF